MKRNKQSGLAALETVAVTPIMILLFVAIVDVGRVMYHSLSTAAAARSAAAYGAQGASFASNTSAMTDFAKADGASLGIDSANPDVFSVTTSQHCICVSESTKLAGCLQTDIDACANGYERYVSVTVARDFETILSYPSFPKSIMLSETATFRVE